MMVRQPGLEHARQGLEPRTPTWQASRRKKVEVEYFIVPSHETVGFL